MVGQSEGSSERSARLLAAIRAGDAEAWEELIDVYGPVVLAIARRRGLTDAECQDVFQETWASLLTQIDALRHPRGLVSWVTQTALRQAFFARRRRRRSHFLGATRVREDEVADDAHTTPLEGLEHLEASAAVRDEVHALPEPCRSILQALFFEPEPPGYAELARRLGRRPTSIGPTRRRCLAALGEQLERRGLR